MLKITYLSHSSFLLDDGDNQLIIDPFITGNTNSPVKDADDIKVQHVVLTHAHGDHLGDGLQIAQNNDATIIAVNELANYVADKGAKAHNMHIGGGWDFPFGRLKFTIAHHGSSSPEGLYMGEPAGVVIKMGGKTVYHAGDTGLFLDMQLIGQLDKIDICMLPIGDNFTMGINDAVKAVEFINPELAIPIHYNTFPVIEADPNEFCRKVTDLGKKCKVMEFGETLEF
jgi:L-ascorbate metabolism protein UlaG (beta-lactamase superfamily)